MKKISISLLFALILSLPLKSIANHCYSYHVCGSCSIIFEQNESIWEYSVACGSEPAQLYYGGGDFDGTFCGGQTPCSL